jgi:flavodoxin
MHDTDYIKIQIYSRRQVLKLTGAAAVLGILAPASLVSSSLAVDVKGSKKLIAYFSMPETDRLGNMTRDEDNSTVVINGTVLGNTQYVAKLIQEKTGGDIFRIEPQKPYPTDHRTLVKLAEEEQDRNDRPVLARQVADMDAYATIFIGYPNWWADMPMILYTFLESYDLSGKTVIPFNTHGGSGFSNTIRTISRLQPNARVLKDGFTVSRDDVDSAEPDVAEWLVGLGYNQR